MGRINGFRIGAALLALAAAAAPAQDINEGEVMVTGSRVRQVYIDPRTNAAIESEEDASGLPSVGLRRRADSALLPVVVAGDTRELEQRREEILTMVRSALDLARRSGLELAVGDFFVVPLTVDNYRTLTFFGDGRPDSERVTFFVKTRLGASDDEANRAITRLEEFVRSVPAAGSAEMRPAGPVPTVVGLRPPSWHARTARARFRALQLRSACARPSRAPSRPRGSCRARPAAARESAVPRSSP